MKQQLATTRWFLADMAKHKRTSRDITHFDNNAAHIHGHHQLQKRRGSKLYKLMNLVHVEILHEYRNVSVLRGFFWKRFMLIFVANALIPLLWWQFNPDSVAGMQVRQLLHHRVGVFGHIVFRASAGFCFFYFGGIFAAKLWLTHAQTREILFSNI